MSPSAAEAMNRRFQERDNPAGKVWDREPRLTLIDEWREHIRRTGEPDTFRYHCHSKPRTEDPPRIIADGFDVPERFRLSKRLAPCTLCSLHGPKYYRGMLAWWPEEKALRAIGHECGVRYWGEAFVQAKRDFSERQEGDRARCDGE